MDWFRCEGFEQTIRGKNRTTVMFRPLLRPGDPGYPEQGGDGTYRIQAGQSERCALTAIGI